MIDRTGIVGVGVVYGGLFLLVFVAWRVFCSGIDSFFTGGDCFILFFAVFFVLFACVGLG